MNRETSIHSSDTLVVVDRSRRRRQLIIAAAVGVALLMLVLFLLPGGVAGLLRRIGSLARSRRAPTPVAGPTETPLAANKTE